MYEIHLHAVAVFLVVLAGVDAAYSGDWSRIGVIPKELEDSLKPLVVALGFFHIGCAFVAGKSAASKNLNVLPAVLKVRNVSHVISLTKRQAAYIQLGLLMLRNMLKYRIDIFCVLGSCSGFSCDGGGACSGASAQSAIGTSARMSVHSFAEGL